jgi:NAD(P)-dependent dehydrogenase (short-subunit alcohol dehydrogenase family)
VFPLVRDAKVAAELSTASPASCFPIVGDVVCPEVEEQIRAVLERHGTALDLLINNAGNIKKLRWLPETTTEDIDSLFEVHCLGAFRCTRAVLPFLRQAAKPLVINLTSRWGSIARTAAGQFRGIYSYQIAKSAQNMLTAGRDQELRSQGIRIAAVHPGKLMTESGAADADTLPREAALRLADWAEAFDFGRVCHDLMAGGIIAW